MSRINVLTFLSEDMLRLCEEILFMLAGIEKFTKPQSLNTASGKEVIPFGNSIFCKLWQPPKAHADMDVRPSGN